MINNIKNEFFEILDKVPWMDAETRLDAKTKVRFIISFLLETNLMVFQIYPIYEGNNDATTHRLS